MTPFATKNTLCWSCQHAVPNYDGSRGCSWSREGRPVEGWDAEASIVKNNDKAGRHYTRSHHVRTCPQFLRDEKREPEE